MTLKQKIYAYSLQVIQDKISLLQQILTDLKESGSNETKSTAGDKHETALAMLQIEQANTRGQLSEVLLQKAVLEKINPAITTPVIVKGSLIETNKGYFYISIALGKMQIENTTIIAISSQSPLGIKFMGLKIDDAIELNGNKYLIKSIV